MNAPVLVLNANFEPVNVCNTRRAIGLILSGKADMVMNGRGYHPDRKRIASAAICHPAGANDPSPAPADQTDRREVFRRDNFTCQYCGRHTGDLTVDHVLPKHLGGEHIWTNVVAACPGCNHRKGGRQLGEVHMNLLHIPMQPPASAYYIFGRHLEENTEWEQLLRVGKRGNFFHFLQEK